MAISDLVDELQQAPEGSRKLDTAIALIIGWRRRVEQTENTENDGGTSRRVLWLVPSSNDVGKVPFFTSSIDAAFELAREISPDDEVGVSWAGGINTAVLGESGYFHAATPALALCAAALFLKMQKNGD